MREGVNVIREQLENLAANEKYMESIKSELDSRIIQVYGDHESVKRYKGTVQSVIDDCLEERQKVLNQVDKLEDPTLRQILFMKFLDRKSNDEIAREVGYGVTHISRKISKGIKDLEKLEE